MNESEWLAEYARLEANCSDVFTGVNRLESYYSGGQLLARIARVKAIEAFNKHLTTNCNNKPKHVGKQ